MKFSNAISCRARAALAALTLATPILATMGCNNGGQTTEVKFPDVSKLPAPVVNEAKQRPQDVGSQSQGDPSSYSR